MSRKPRSTRRNWSFLEVVVALFVLGLFVEFVALLLPNSGTTGWLWILPGIAALIALMWLVAREPANL